MPTLAEPPAVKASPSTASVRFAVIGDYGLASQPELDVANLVKSWNPDFIITTGDNNYPLGAQSTIDQNIGQYYRDFIYPYVGSYGAGAAENRFFPSLGNHDWYTAGAAPYLSYFTLPGNERYYDFSRGPVQFFAIDSDSNEPDGNSSTSIQAAWLQNHLAGSCVTWKIVYLHHAPYSSGTGHGSTTIMQWPYAVWGASAVLAGHDHTYERIIQNGIPYFVNGLGGSSIYTFTVPLVPGSAAHYNSDYGAMLVDADNTSITFQFIARTGTAIDSYTVNAAAPAFCQSYFPLIMK
ncbi:MAG: metallophosphoesterase [Chloroflexota bacterium]|nr:metallophosphoesterase [Chloroflexota bacterium]